ncbi:MAG: hypothetical protein ACHQE6_10255 [Solirubrobacterales bacterium]
MYTTVATVSDGLAQVQSTTADRSAPFRVRLTVTRTATSGSTIKLRAKAYLEIHGGKRRAKPITVAVKVC